MRIANFMDSSLLDLERKGVLSGASEIYNPQGAYELVLHFTPHEADLALSSHFSSNRIRLVHHPAGWISPKRIFKALALARRLFRQEKIELVRGRLPYLGSLIGAIAARLCAIPFVVSLGGDNRIGQTRNGEYYYGSRRISYAMEHLVLRLASSISFPIRSRYDTSARSSVLDEPTDVR